jgi:predicted DNA repair protein MutK
MPATGLLALLDDITTLLDDVAVMTKVASKKTAAIIGDDLALNANQLVGMTASRELPVVWAVCKGSLVNKAILIPVLLGITAFLPWLITPLLMLGGAYLCYEGAEKILHKIFDSSEDKPTADAEPAVEPHTLERKRVRGAVFTDFILSAEILVIALGSAVGSSLLTQALSLSVIGIGMTVFVYGTVALIVKSDDFGIRLQQDSGKSSGSRLKRRIGRLIVSGAPKFMNLLSILGTVAMFLVGGEIVSHGIPFVENMIKGLAYSAGIFITGVEGSISWIASVILAMLWGAILGIFILMLKKIALRIWNAVF